MENNILSLFSSLMGQNNQSQNNTQNPSVANYPKEAFQDMEQSSQTQNVDNGLGGIMPLLMQMMGGKGNGANIAGLESIIKGGTPDISSLLKQNNSSSNTKKNGVPPKDDLIL